MHRIYAWVRDGEDPNCVRITAEFEVDRKTALRDIRFMQDRMGLPIAYDYKRHGYCFEGPVAGFPGVPVTEKELFGLCVVPGSFGVMAGKGDYEVVIEMDAWLTDTLRGRRWHPKQVWTELPGGGSQLRLRLSCLEEIEQYVLSWGAHASVVGPRELVERVARTAREVVKRYGGAGM